MCTGEYIGYNCGHTYTHWITRCETQNCKPKYDFPSTRPNEKCLKCMTPWEKEKKDTQKAKDNIPSDIKRLDEKLEKLIEACNLNTHELKSSSAEIIKVLQTRNPDVPAAIANNQKQALQKTAANGIVTLITSSLEHLENEVMSLQKGLQAKIVDLRLSIGAQNDMAEKVLKKACQSMIDSVKRRFQESRAKIEKSTEADVIKLLDLFI